jgi:hypothetical protein
LLLAFGFVDNSANGSFVGPWADFAGILVKLKEYKFDIILSIYQVEFNSSLGMVAACLHYSLTLALYCSQI